MSFGTEIKVDGQPVIINVPTGSIAWQRANSIYVPIGPAPTSAYFILEKQHVEQLSQTAAMAVTWNQSGPREQNLTFGGLYFKQAGRVLPGGTSPKSLFLCEFVDGRYLASRKSDSGEIIANARSYAQDSDFLDGTAKSWDTLISTLWAACGYLGFYAGLPFAPDSVPDSLWFTGQNAYKCLCTVLDQLDCALAPDPFSDIAGDPFAQAYNIVQLGSEQDIVLDKTLKWDSEKIQTNIDVAETLRIYFPKHLRGYGQERDTEIDDNWVVNGKIDTSDQATNIQDATGTKPVWDDLHEVIDETGAVENAGEVAARAAARAARYALRRSVTAIHRVHVGLRTDFIPGGQIRSVLWRNYNDTANPIGGTVTEFTAGADLPPPRDGRPGTLAWFEDELGMPEREAWTTQDLSRRTTPVYPRLPNIVQVYHASADVGEVVNAVGGFHPGKVRRWVNGVLETLEDCLIRFVDNHDTLEGNVPAIQGQLYGPGRLSGVEEVTGTKYPVYTVSQGAGGSANLIFFQLYEDKDIDQPKALARILTFNGTNFVDSGQTVYVWDDYWPAPNGPFGGAKGAFQGHAHIDRGWAVFRNNADPEDEADLAGYTIVWMSGPAHKIIASLNEPIAEVDGVYQAEAQIEDPDTHIYLGNSGGFPDPEVAATITVYDPRLLWTFGVVGSRLWATWNDRTRRYEIDLLEQYHLRGSGTLQFNLCGDASAYLDTVSFQSPFPFTRVPDFGELPTDAVAVVQNPLGLAGMAGDTVLFDLNCDYTNGDWQYDIVNITHHQQELVTDVRIYGLDFQKKTRVCYVMGCQSESDWTTYHVGTTCDTSGSGSGSGSG